jgi:plasmid stabilization system protein ParE
MIRPPQSVYSIGSTKFVRCWRHPRAGKRRDDLAAGLRFYPVGNYLVFYVPRNDGIAVARILHGGRDYRQEFR